MELPGRERWIAYRDRLIDALLEPAPETSRDHGASSLPVVTAAADVDDDPEAEIVAHARAAAGLGALPVVDLIGVTALQARMLRRLADRRELCWDRELARHFVASLGPGLAGGIVGHTIGRSAFKIIPFVGQTAGAAWSARSSTIATYAIGKAADYFLACHRAGSAADPAALRRIHHLAARAASTRLTQIVGSMDD